MSQNKESLKQELIQALSRAERFLSKEKYSFRERFDLLDPIKIMPFHGFGSNNYIFLKGRVLEKQKMKEEPDGETIIEHLEDMYKRYASDEIPHIRLQAHFSGKTKEVETDSEGYFEVEFTFEEPVNFQESGQKVKVSLLEQKTKEDKIEAEGHIFVPGQKAEFGVISDIDDTVLVSQVTDIIAEWKLKLLKDASQRHPFPGIAAFLRALKRGANGKGDNPLFFVSGSEWNLFDLLINFFRYHDIPVGPLLLRDKGTRLDKGKLETSQQEYKLKKMRHILETYPQMKFIFIGDSGEHDPESYRKIQKEYPNQILAIYIRDISAKKRDLEINKIKKSLQQKDVQMFYTEETFSAAKHALNMGWINKDQLDEVRESCREDEGQ